MRGGAYRAVAAQVDHRAHQAQAAAVVFLFQRGVIVIDLTELDGYVMITLRESPGLWNLDIGRFIDLPILVHAVVHFFRRVVDAMDVPNQGRLRIHDAVHNGVARSELAQPQALVIFGTHAELEAPDLAILIFEIMETSHLDIIIVNHCSLLS
jgi:hypothetical protein